MSEEIDVIRALELCGFTTGERQESRLMNLLTVILKLQSDPPIPLTFGDIYDELLRENPKSKLTKAWIHRVLKSLVDVQLVRLESPTSTRKRYIADVNTVMAGLEQLKSKRIKELEAQKAEIDETLELINNLECGDLAQQLVKNVTGTQQKISSRIVRGVDELHRVLKYNMLDVAKKGDIIRATMLWFGPFLDHGILDRTQKFLDAAIRGTDVRYLMSTEIFKMGGLLQREVDFERAGRVLRSIVDLKRKGLKIDFRIYSGPKTYNQVSLNNDNMALIIAENPVTATWITREFNPDLIDNAVKAFDRDWKKAKSFLDLKPEEIQALGGEPGGLISKLFQGENG
ncbi:MAG: hypothetical protein ACFFE2_11625 [Candidatus Thorarchaeota archaeon]